MRYSVLAFAMGLCVTAVPAQSAVAQGPGPAHAPAAQPAAAILSTILHPPIKIIDAAVLDPRGASIGTVARVEVTPAGVPLAVAVALPGKPGHITVLDAKAVRYDPTTNRIIANSGAHS